MGDSYNDTAMIKEADKGLLFRPSEKVVKAFPELPVVTEYSEVIAAIEEFAR